MKLKKKAEEARKKRIDRRLVRFFMMKLAKSSVSHLILFHCEQRVRCNLAISRDRK